MAAELFHSYQTENLEQNQTYATEAAEQIDPSRPDNLPFVAYPAFYYPFPSANPLIWSRRQTT